MHAYKTPCRAFSMFSPTAAEIVLFAEKIDMPTQLARRHVTSLN